MMQYLAAAHLAALLLWPWQPAGLLLPSCPVWTPVQPLAELFSLLSTQLCSWLAYQPEQHFLRQAQELKQALLKGLRQGGTLLMHQ